MQRTMTVVDMFAPWTKAQQTFWDRWRAALANGATPVHSAVSLWNLPLEFWKVAIYGSLDVQLATAEVWKAWICANDANIPEITSGACQVAHFAEEWTYAQERLWDSWFAAFEGLVPEVATQSADVARGGAKPRVHERVRRQTSAVHTQPQNGVAT